MVSSSSSLSTSGLYSSSPSPCTSSSDMTDSALLGLAEALAEADALPCSTARDSASRLEYFSVLSTMKLRCWSSASFFLLSSLILSLYSNSLLTLLQKVFTSLAMVRAIFLRFASLVRSALATASSLSLKCFWIIMAHFLAFTFLVFTSCCTTPASQTISSSTKSQWILPWPWPSPSLLASFLPPHSPSRCSSPTLLSTSASDLACAECWNSVLSFLSFFFGTFTTTDSSFACSLGSAMGSAVVSASMAAGAVLVRSLLATPSSSVLSTLDCRDTRLFLSILPSNSSLLSLASATSFSTISCTFSLSSFFCSPTSFTAAFASSKGALLLPLTLVRSLLPTGLPHSSFSSSTLPSSPFSCSPLSSWLFPSSPSSTSTLSSCPLSFTSLSSSPFSTSPLSS